MGDGPTGERWLPVDGYRGLYEVSDQGRVRSVDRVSPTGARLKGRVLKPYVSPRFGRVTVHLCRYGKKHPKLVAHLVAHAFIGPRPRGQLVRHWNDNPGDNRVDNLLYGTHSDNSFDCVRNGHNRNALAEACPRGHRLAEPNLVVGHGGRTCLACARAKAWVQRYPVEDFETHADLYYEAIMAGRPMSDRPARFTYVNASKTKCIRGHALSGPNLKVVVRPTRTYRNCHACTDAGRLVRSAAARGIELDIKVESDKVYRKLMGGEEAA